MGMKSETLIKPNVAPRSRGRAGEDKVPEVDALVRLRVCHLIGCLQYGGAERQVVNLLNELPFRSRFVLEIGRPTPEGLHQLLDAGVIRASMRVRMRRLPLDLVRLARLLRGWHIDILHTHMYSANLIGALAGRLAGVPVVVTSEHGKNHWKRAHHHWVERRVISPLVDLRFCASEDIRQLRQEVDGVPGEKLVYMPNGTTLPSLERREANPVPVLGCVGRLIKAKDYGTLIEAVAMLRSAGIDCRLEIVGDGPERGMIEGVVAEYGLQPRVNLVGFQSDISRWLRRFDLFVMPSIREGQPLALLEAMAHGLPIVATRVGGIPLTVEPGVEAELVEPGNPGQLAHALRLLLEDRGRMANLGESARRRVEKEFSIQAVSARYARTYCRLWERKHGPES